MKNSSTKTKLLTVVTDNRKGSYLLEIIKRNGIKGCTKIFGKSCNNQNECYLYSNTQEILLSVITQSSNQIINAISEAALLDNDLSATILLFDAFNFELAFTGIQDDLTLDSDLNRSNKMEQKMNLIVTIVNRGHTEEIMATARSAGAQGGTVVGAKGTGTEEDAIFFGISLAPEKEMLLILAASGDTQQIIEAIKSQPIFNERGMGILFTLNVEQAFSFNS